MKFKCIKCGSCCKNISDKGSSSNGLPLFEWEAKRLKKLKKGIKIEPLDVFYDEKSKIYFCLGYLLIGEPCVFLKNKKCSIYKKRPLICRAFPVAKHPLFLEDAPNLSCFSKCCNFDFNRFLSESLGLKKGKPYKISREKILKEYNGTFGKEIIKAALKKDKTLISFENILRGLTERKIVNLKRIKDYRHKKVISFSEFLIKRKFVT
jgi:Fe-S-cluster containining protein